MMENFFGLMKSELLYLQEWDWEGYKKGKLTQILEKFADSSFYADLVVTHKVI
jgi:hypothetical protein